MPPRSVKKQAPLPGMFKPEKRGADLIHDFDLLEKPQAKKQARMPPPPSVPLIAEDHRSGAAFVRLDGVKNELNNRFSAMSKDIDRQMRYDLGAFLGEMCDVIGTKAAAHLEILNDSIKNSQLAQQQIAENHVSAMKAVKGAYEEETNRASEKDEEILTLIEKVRHSATNEAQSLLAKYITPPGTGSFAMV